MGAAVIDMEQDCGLSKDELLALVKLQSAGRLTGEDLESEARRKAHPLHHRFEWDDSVAGRLHRIRQAQEIIRMPRYRSEVVTGPVMHAPRYVPSPVTPRAYVDLRQVKTEQHREAVMRMEISRAIGHIARCAAIAQELDHWSCKQVQESLRTLRSIEASITAG